jgi:NADH-quinone oxidoreductase subunit J
MSTATFAADLWVAQNIAFYVIAAAMVVAAIRVVTSNDILHAALWLVVVLGGAAGQFVLLAAEFVATTQVLVYIGAIMVLFIFGVMLTRASIGGGDDLDNPRQAKAAGAVVAVIMAAVLGYTLWDGFGDRHLGQLTVQRTAAVSDSIFSTYLLPFEVISVLLLAALIGAIVLARRD